MSRLPEADAEAPDRSYGGWHPFPFLSLIIGPFDCLDHSAYSYEVAPHSDERSHFGSILAVTDTRRSLPTRTSEKTSFSLSPGTNSRPIARNVPEPGHPRMHVSA